MPERAPVPDHVPCIAVVGHTNVGKTSLLRTLTRRVDFGRVSDQPGTTRHAEVVALRLEGQVQMRFVDTPGLEDAVALHEFLQQQAGETRLQRIKAFLRGPEARAAFEQEAKVLRTLLERADAAMLVLDVREPVLPKYRAELDLLVACARPLMPVLNFARSERARSAEWHQLLRESGLHARAEFDAVAPLHGAEQQLYNDLAALLPAWRVHLQGIVDGLALQAQDRLRAAARSVADTLVGVAAMRRTTPARDLADDAQRRAFVAAFQREAQEHARTGVAGLLELFGFRAGDAELAGLPVSDGRWASDLFNPELLKRVSVRLGVGALVGAGAGVVVDVALAGLSLGAATGVGAALGGAASGGWRPVWRKVQNRLTGVREVTVEDAVLVLLASRLCDLALALARRGHAAEQRLLLAPDGHAPAADDAARHELAALVRTLAPARGHPEWERGTRRFDDSAGRAALCSAVAVRLEELLLQTPGAGGV